MTRGCPHCGHHTLPGQVCVGCGYPMPSRVNKQRRTNPMRRAELRRWLEAFYETGYDESDVLEIMAELAGEEPNTEYKKVKKLLLSTAEDVASILS